MQVSEWHKKTAAALSAAAAVLSFGWLLFLALDGVYTLYGKRKPVMIEDTGDGVNIFALS